MEVVESSGVSLESLTLVTPRRSTRQVVIAAAAKQATTSNGSTVAGRNGSGRMKKPAPRVKRKYSVSRGGGFGLQQLMTGDSIQFLFEAPPSSLRSILTSPVGGPPPVQPRRQKGKGRRRGTNTPSQWAALSLCKRASSIQRQRQQLQGGDHNAGKGEGERKKELRQLRFNMDGTRVMDITPLPDKPDGRVRMPVYEGRDSDQQPGGSGVAVEGKVDKRRNKRREKIKARITEVIELGISSSEDEGKSAAVPEVVAVEKERSGITLNKVQLW